MNYKTDFDSMIWGKEVGVTNCNCYYYYTINTYDWIILDYITIDYKYQWWLSNKIYLFGMGL